MDDVGTAINEIFSPNFAKFRVYFAKWVTLCNLNVGKSGQKDVKKLGKSGQKVAFSWWKNGQDENDILRRNRKKSKALLISHTNTSAHEEPISLKNKKTRQVCELPQIVRTAQNSPLMQGYENQTANWHRNSSGVSLLFSLYA